MELPIRFTNDGRNFDHRLADLGGEAIDLKVDPEHPAKVSQMAIVKGPVWTWEVPAYLALGGIAGASSTLAAAVALVGGPGSTAFASRAQWVSLAGAGVGAGLLVMDLGRPERFYNMLRVFRPTSPMNVGSWVLAGQSVSTGAAIAFSLLPMRGAGALSRAAGLSAGLLGLPLSGYTGVLLGATANPLWFENRDLLPPLFVSSAMSAGGGAMTLAGAGLPAARSAELFGLAGRVADLVVSRRRKKRIKQFPALERAAETGTPGRLEKAATAATAASLVLGVVGLRNRPARMAGAVLAIGGSVLQRFAVFNAGQAAAGDPEAVLETQRR